MASRAVLCLFALTLLLQLGGCGHRTPKAAPLTPSQARQSLDAIYAGSLGSLPLDPRFQMNAALTGDTAQLLRDQFGGVKGVQFKSSGQANPQVEETVWMVTKEKLKRPHAQRNRDSTTLHEGGLQRILRVAGDSEKRKRR